jgi:hypothetical protein
VEGSQVAARGFPLHIAKNQRGKLNPVSVFSATDRLVKRHLFKANKELTKLAPLGRAHLRTFRGAVGQKLFFPLLIINFYC